LRTREAATTDANVTLIDHRPLLGRIYSLQILFSRLNAIPPRRGGEGGRANLDDNEEVIAKIMGYSKIEIVQAGEKKVS
jgi:hypothetical protein